MTYATFRDFTPSELERNLSDALDYYERETGERDVPTYGYAAEGFEEAERIFAMDYDDRVSALDDVGMTDGIGGTVKHHAAALKLREMEQSEWGICA